MGTLHSAGVGLAALYGLSSYGENLLERYPLPRLLDGVFSMIVGHSLYDIVCMFIKGFLDASRKKKKGILKLLS